MSNQIVISSGAKVRELQDVIIGTSGVLSSLGFDVANGVPKLDSNGKILVSQLPNSVMEYKGTWNVSTNTPTLANGTGNQGDVYLVEGAAVGGTAFNFGAGPITFFNGDQAIYSGSIWQRASGATGTVTSVAALTIGTSGTDLSSTVATSTTTPVITLNVPTASATNRGALSSADWTTFNNKQSALTNPVTGTGTTNTLPKFTASSTLGNSNISDSGTLITLGSQTYISTGGLGIGTSSLNNSSLRVTANITGAVSVAAIQSSGVIQTDVTTSGNYFQTSASVAASATVPTVSHFTATQGVFNTGSTVTNQYGFFVNTTLTGATNNYAFFSNMAASTGRWNFYSQGTASNYFAGSLGLGTTTLTGYTLNIGKTITGAVTSYAINQSGIVQSDVTTAVFGHRNSLQTAAAAFTLPNYYHYAAVQSTIGSTSAVTNQYGYFADSTMIGATNNYGFYGNIASGTNRWNLYMAGTAANYMAGTLNIGSTTLSGYTLDVSGTGRFTGALTGTSATFSSSVTAKADLNSYVFKMSPNTDTIAAGNYTEFLMAMRNTGDYTGSIRLISKNASGSYLAPRIGFYLVPEDNNSYASMIERLSILGNGNVGIGTSSPQANLQVTSSSFPVLKVADGIGGGALALGDSTITSNYVGIWRGTANSISGGGFLNIQGNGIAFMSSDNIFGSGSERMRITSGGNVLIGTTTDGGTHKLQVNGSIIATGFFESSDSRLKTLIQDNYQTKGIASITPKLYTKNGKVELGYYAQDFVGVLDSAVSKGSDDMLSLSYREVHTAKIYALEQEIKELKAKMN